MSHSIPRRGMHRVNSAISMCRLIAPVVLLSLIDVGPAPVCAQGSGNSEELPAARMEAEMRAVKDGIPPHTTIPATRLDSTKLTVVAYVFQVSAATIRRFRWGPSAAPLGHLA